MLDLMDNSTKVKTVHDGQQFTLPNGDVVSPAYAGWRNGVYSLVVSPVAPPTPPTMAEQIAFRQAAYATESDPIFFMAQRGEATMDEWTAKITEIKARYPYPTE